MVEAIKRQLFIKKIMRDVDSSDVD